MELVSARVAGSGGNSLAIYRYTNNDMDVPSWSADDERRHWRAHVPVSAEALHEYRERQRTTDTRPIKKVAEAKACKKKRAERRMARTQKRSETIADNPDLCAAEKQRQLVKSVVRALSRSHVRAQNARAGDRQASADQVH